VLVRKDEVKKPQLCGFSLYSAFTFGRSEKIAVQTTLKELGHYNGAIDGDFGRNSCKALKSYLTSRSLQTYNNKLLKSDIDKLISIAKKKITPAATASSPNLATSEQYGISNAKNNDGSTEGKETQTVGAADNKLGLENASLRKTVGDKEKLITELQTQIEGIRKTAKSSGEEAAGLKALTLEQKKLTAALKERITALETASLLVKTELLQAEQKALEQATKIDGFQTTSTELKQRIVSLETQNKRFEISELETNKQLESLGAEQAVLQEEKEVLFTSNEVLKLENGSLSAKLKKLGSKSLFEGGLSGKSLVSGDDKKDETNSATNSLGGNLISKKLIKIYKMKMPSFGRLKLKT
jgi:regulator of replication initiation timing